MNKYIRNRNKQPLFNGGNYEIHNADNGACSHLPDISSCLDIGHFENCNDAIKQARILWPDIAGDIDGCYYCCEACHTE
ncbi:MAG: hypothetical protein HRU29_08965 [Rhizobiales bacterium]|nr:hypothetical protein [Hyphomicrobiales bacterium]NRB14518.1 hypothetical protein [Hyphomicrobiales bacterium]